MSLTIDSILRRSTILIAVATVALYYKYGDSMRIDEMTVVWAMLNAVLCYVLLLVSNKRKIELLFMLAFTIVLWCLLRIPAMILIPTVPGDPIIWYFNTLITLSPEDINRTLKYVFYGSLLMSIGIVLANRLCSKTHSGCIKSTQIDMFIDQDKYFLIVSRFLLVCILITSAAYMFGGVGLYHSNWYLETFLRLVDISLVILIFCYLYIGQTESFRKKYLKRFLTVFSLVAIVMIMRGSRALIYQLIIFYLAIILVKDRARQISLTKILALVLVGFVSFTVAIAFKVSRDFQISSPLTLLKEAGDVARSDNAIGMKYPLFAISARVNVLEPMTVVLSADEDTYNAAAREFINYNNEFGAAVNKFIPGTIFPGAKDTDTKFDHIYRGVSEDEESGHTSLWSGFGLMYLHHGYAGGLVMLFILGFAFETFYRLGKRIDRYGDFIGVYILLVLHDFVTSHGIDTHVFGIIQFSVLILFYNILLRLRIVPFNNSERGTLQHM